MKSLLSILFSLLITSTIVAQAINGKITTTKDEPIAYVNAVLYKSDGTLISGEISDDDGKFTFLDVKNGKYYLEASFLGYQTTISDTFELSDQSPKEMSIIMKEESTLLNTIVVEGRKPLLEQRADKLVVNVADNLTSLNSSVMDVMKKVPGMMVVNDQLKMAGQPNVTILIDGKTTQYMDMGSLLRDMPGDNIQKIEVIHQPGAEYDASGSGAIINIILKKNSFLGTNGSIYAGVGKSYDWLYNAGVSISSYQKNLNIQGGLSYNQNSYYDELEIFRRVGEGSFNQITRDPIDPASYRGNLTLDYDIDDRHRIGVGGRIIQSATNKVADNVTDVAQTNSNQFSLNTKNTADRSWNLFSINPYYKFEIDTAGQKLAVDFNYVDFGRDNMNTLASRNTTENFDLSQEDYRQIGDNKIWAAELNYTKPFNNQLSMKLGGKYSDANLDNDLVARYEVGNVWINNDGQSNHYLFDETIGALYSKLSFDNGKWSGSAGLRYESSISTGYSITQDTTLSRTINKLFPSASIGRKLGSSLALSFAYSYRIDRPSYSSLNPFIYYYDPYTFERGNPNLRPELTHSMKMSLAYEGQPFFNVEYKSTDDAMVEVTEQDDITGETSRLTVNLASNKNFNTSLFFPLDFIPGVSGYGGAILNYREIDSKYLNQDFFRSLWSVTSFVQVNFKLPGDINTEISGWHNSGSQEGIIRSNWLYGVSFGLSKKVLDGQGKISLGMEDAFNRFWHGNINYANMDADIVSRWQAKVVNARFSYKFGNKHMKKKSRNRGSASDQINRLDTNG